MQADHTMNSDERALAFMMVKTTNTEIAARPLERRWVRALLLVLIWTFIAVLIASLSHLRMLYLGNESHYWKWLLDSVIGWNAWAALTPVIIWLGRKVKIEREVWLSRALWHVPMAIGIVTIRAMFGIFTSMVVMGETLTIATYLDQMLRYLIWMAPWDLVIYGGILGFSYAIEYRRQLRDRELESVRLEAALSKAQLDALHAQLQPHFLFNTLNSISVLMQTGRVDSADRMLRHLSELLRYVLAKGTLQEVTLDEEMKFVNGYLDIEQARFGARLTINITIPTEHLTALVPSFLIQTLVENAIRHGVGPKSEPGTVSIQVSRRGDRMLIEVADDGIGMKQDADSNSGVGLRNARARLQRLYGSSATLEISRPEAGGTVVRLELPYRREE